MYFKFVRMSELFVCLFVSQFKDQMPKAPSNAFMLFNIDVSHQLKQKYPGLTQHELANKTGEDI